MTQKQIIKSRMDKIIQQYPDKLQLLQDLRSRLCLDIDWDSIIIPKGE